MLLFFTLTTPLYCHLSAASDNVTDSDNEYDTFPFGTASFRDLYAPAKFFSDKTGFIRALEQNLGAKGKAVLALFPRRFGKSMFLDTLSEYYDIRNKDSFQSLFGLLNIGREPTPKRNAYMILKLDFSGLDSESYAGFNKSFSDSIVKAVRPLIHERVHCRRLRSP